MMAVTAVTSTTAFVSGSHAGSSSCEYHRKYWTTVHASAGVSTKMFARLSGGESDEL